MVVWQNERYQIIRLSCMRCGCYVLRHGEFNLLVDTSMKFERGRLIKSLKENGIGRLDALLLTHNHADHAANAAYLHRLFGCPVYASAKGTGALRTGLGPMPKGNSLYGKLLYPLVIHTPFRWLMQYEPIPDVCEAAGILQSGMLGDGIELIETPGHTADSISLIVDGQAALVGDAFVRLPWQKSVFLPWANEPEKIAATWELLRSKNCGCYFEAHGPAATGKMLVAALK